MLKSNPDAPGTEEGADAVPNNHLEGNGVLTSVFRKQ